MNHPPRALVPLALFAAAGCGVEGAPSAPVTDAEQRTLALHLDLTPAQIEDLKGMAEARGIPLSQSILRYGWHPRFSELVDELRSRHGGQFAGAAATPDSPYDAMLAFRAEVPDGLDTDPRLEGLKIEWRTHLGYTEADLQAQLDVVHDAIREAGYPDVVSTYDVETGLVEVQIAAGKADPAKVYDRLPGVAFGKNVVVEVIDALPGKNELLFGGGQLERVGFGGLSCTAGFMVRRGGTSGMITAGHCRDALSLENEPGDPEHVGTLEDQHEGNWGDMQWHTFTTDTVDTNFYWDAGRRRDAWRTRGTWKGMSICRFGHRTGRHCDEVYRESVSSGGEKRLSATRNENADGGDSGGPWYYGNSIYGVHKGEKWIWFKMRDVFSQLQYADEAINVRPALCASRTACHSWECGEVSVGCGRQLWCGACSPCLGSACSDGSCCPNSGVCPNGQFCFL